MPTYYAGPGGNDGNNGTTWALRKLTLNGAEDIPVAAGDTVYVGPGVYRETLTVDVSGAAGSPITYIGDYTGVNTDGVGGVVRITGSDNDQTAVRTNGIVSAAVRHYRTFRNFLIDTATGNLISASSTGMTDWIIERCCFVPTSTSWPIACTGANQRNWTIRQCYSIGRGGLALFQHTATVSNTAHVVENCVVVGAQLSGIRSVRVGGFTIRNCAFHTGYRAVEVNTALALGQTITVNNCINTGFSNVALVATALGEIISDGNVFFDNATSYFNVAAGVNDITYPPLLDARWFFEAVNGGRLITPFDLGRWSQLIDLAGLNPPATDLRGTGQIGAARERGPLEYDMTLLIEGGGGAVSISPYRGNL